MHSMVASSALVPRVASSSTAFTVLRRDVTLVTITCEMKSAIWGAQFSQKVALFPLSCVRPENICLSRHCHRETMWRCFALFTVTLSGLSELCWVQCAVLSEQCDRREVQRSHLKVTICWRKKNNLLTQLGPREVLIKKTHHTLGNGYSKTRKFADRQIFGSLQESTLTLKYSSLNSTE